MKTTSKFQLKKVVVMLMAFVVPCVMFAQDDDLPTNRIFDILIDGSNLWIAGDTGIIKYDKITGKETVYQPFKGECYYGATTVLGLAKDNEGNLWATPYCSGGIGKFENEKWTIYDVQQGTFPFSRDIIIDRENNKWIGTPISLMKSDNENWKSWMTDCGYSSAPFITAMALDHDENLWIGGHSPDCKFGKFTGDGFEYYDMDASNITKIFVDGRNNLWIATTNNGLKKYDKELFTFYTTENSDIPGNTIHDIKADKEGNLWLACDRYLVKFDGTSFTKYEHPDIKSWTLCLSIEDNGDIWVGTLEAGFYLFTDGKLCPIDLFPPVSIEETDKTKSNFTVFANASDIVIDFSLTETAQVSLFVCDIQGREVCNILKNQNLISGKHQYSCTHTIFSSGVYLVRCVINGVADVKKVVIP